MNIGESIKRLRTEKGITQIELASRSRLSVTSIQNYEYGKTTPKVEQLEKIAAALDVTPFDLMGAEYWDKKYPDLSEKVSGYEGFIDYLNSLGYVVKDVPTETKIPVTEFEKDGKMDLVPPAALEAGYVVGESHEVKIIQGRKSVTLTEEQFSDLQNCSKDLIAFKLWQYRQQNQ